MIGEHVSSQGLQPDVILASSAVRVQETVSLLQETLAGDAEILTEKSLYLASPDMIVGQVKALHDSWDTAMVVGHNPGICALVCDLAEQSLEMPTAAVALFQANVDSWSNSFMSLNWQLQDYWRPRDLEASS